MVSISPCCMGRVEQFTPAMVGYGWLVGWGQGSSSSSVKSVSRNLTLTGDGHMEAGRWDAGEVGIWGGGEMGSTQVGRWDQGIVEDVLGY